MKRITAIVGHYGSGKTEVAVNLAVKEAKKGMSIALVDLDIANPYFRSRERQSLLEKLGISVYFNSFGFDIGEDLPAIAAVIRKPLEDKNCRVIIDAGGNGSGARILKQFDKYFSWEETEILCIINANRPETDTTEKCLYFLEDIEKEMGRKIDAIVNNTHMLRETEVGDIEKGIRLCMEVAERKNIPFLFSTLQNGLNLGIIGDKEKLMELDLFMRPSWLDALVR